MYPTITISPSLSIPTYYFVISAVVCICLLWITVRSEAAELSRKITLDLSLILMIGGFIGGRMFHVFYEDFEYYRQEPLRIFEFWNGGFVFYGGALFSGFVGVLYLLAKAPKNYGQYLDLFAPVLAFAYAAGRGACFLAGCCYGRYCELPWAIGGRHPTQLYAAAWEMGVVFILLGIRPSPFFQHPGRVFYLWMILHGIGRFVMEAFRDDFRGPSLGLSISSWISLGLIITGLIFLFLRPKAAK